MTSISPHAIVDPKAELATDVEVGPWSYIGPGVHIDSGTIIGTHCVIKGPSRIGKQNRFFSFCSIGEDTQDLKYKGEETWLEIGNNNTFREHVSVHRGTIQDQGLTRIGNHNICLTASHVAHDCILGDHIILSHNAGLAGHVVLGDHVTISGYSGVHQYCRVGDHAFIARNTFVLKDVPPCLMVSGNENAKPRGLNTIGLQRFGASKEDLSALKEAYKILYMRGLSLEEALAQLEQLSGSSTFVGGIARFIAEDISRGVIR